MATPSTSSKQGISLDQSIERMRQQLAKLGHFLGRGASTHSLEEFDLDTERLIVELLGQASDFLHAYEYAELGEAAGLVNIPDEAPEGAGMDRQRQSVIQRSRVLESCISELEARRSAQRKNLNVGPMLMGPQIAEHMSADIRSVSQDATLLEAGQLMQQWKVGSLLVTDSTSYVGVLTDSALASEVVVNRRDTSTTTVKTCMRTPIVAIQGDRPIIDAVRMMKEQATRHLAVMQDEQIIGVISVSNVLRYYSGVV